MTKAHAFFDVDGTLTTCDSFLENIRFQKGTLRMLLGFIWLSPWIVAYKVGIISNQKAKERALMHFFGGMKANEFQEASATFARQQLPLYLRAKGMEEIERHLALGHQVILVTASSPEWIAAAFERFPSIRIEGTRLQLKEGRLTGMVDGKNCYGAEKVIRMKQYTRDFDGPTYGYGDTKGDLPLLRETTFRFYRPFR